MGRVHEQFLHLDRLEVEVGEWAQRTFPRSTLHSIAAHLHEEVAEFVQHVSNGEVEAADKEAADVLLLLLHYCFRRDKSLYGLACIKHEENQRRKWDEGAERGYSKHIPEDAS